MGIVSLREAGEHAHRILDTVRQGARATDDDEMARSWTRCLEQHRLHPDRPHRPSVVPAAQLAQRQERLADVIDCARHEMATLYQQLADTESAVVLTDTDGVILHMVSSPAFAEDVTPLGFHVGAVWSEAEAGTNGMGTCLVAASPVAVRREDHFFTRLTSLTCSAVPVFDPQGQMTAVLDVTSRSSLQQQHSLVLLGMTAQMIENRLLELRHPEAHLLHFHSRPEFVYTLHEGKLALEGDGRILAGNRSALFQLGLHSVAELRERRLEDLLHTRLAELVERCRRSAFHPVVSFGAQGASRFFVVARPPASETGAHELPVALTGPSTGTRARALVPRMEPRRDATLPPRAAPAFGDPRLSGQLDQARRAIARDIPVLLHGETGAGKEVFARALHAASPKHAGSFVAVNCASLPESLIEAELFGYRAGAFTGAQRSGRRGKVLEADRGTLFLDEIGDMPLALQARLLRVLDERKVTPLGAEETVDVDFQLVSASHRPLAQMVEEGRFREDLYYRLCGFEVSLPALRERSDRRALIAELLALESGGLASLTPDAQALLEQHPWPGNVRQLRHALRTALALADDDGRIDLPHLASLRAATVRTGAPLTLPAPAAPTSVDNEAPALPPMNPIQAKEREVLLQLLEDHRWNVSNVAKALDVSRNTLYRKLHKLHIALSHPGSGPATAG
ncbi:sigma-54-dependent Fis family transcriptional regulator [Methylibium petroleiphilum]|uniref:sigma-54-dependent Fis family transcriptional regulator n=1 Tax=Methylibium petroleiphilum TaxID=105560 RepID=UPI001AD08319|nr:sigma-54-dependent Fis family transcriptional regulator [Methylibium petroleiphilum]MBN9205357.1 sigma-54-dependent Fis family transcriptional regulator [Methylibium petroleiphilum]